MPSLNKIKQRTAEELAWKLKVPFSGKWLFVSPNSSYRAGLTSRKWLVAYEGEGCCLIDSASPVDPFDLKKAKFPLNDAILISGLLNVIFDHEDFNAALIAEMGLTRKPTELPALPAPEEETEEPQKLMLYDTPDTLDETVAPTISVEMHPGAQDESQANIEPQTHHADTTEISGNQ